MITKFNFKYETLLELLDTYFDNNFDISFYIDYRTINIIMNDYNSFWMEIANRYQEYLYNEEFIFLLEVYKNHAYTYYEIIKELYDNKKYHISDYQSSVTQLLEILLDVVVRLENEKEGIIQEDYETK